MEDRASRLLNEEVVNDFANGHLAHLVDRLGFFLVEPDFERITALISEHRMEFQNPVTRDGVAQALDLPRDFTQDDILRMVFLGDETTLVGNLVTHLLAGSPNDVKAGQKLAKFESADLTGLAVLETVFLYVSGEKAHHAKVGSFPTKKTREALGSDLHVLENLMKRVEAAREYRLRLITLERSLAVHDFAYAFLSERDNR